MEMHDGYDDDLSIQCSIQYAIGKAFQAIPAQMIAERRPRVRELADASQAYVYGAGKFTAEPSALNVIVSDGFVDFRLGRDEEPDRHGFRCFASTSAASRASISPRL